MVISDIRKLGMDRICKTSKQDQYKDKDNPNSWERVFETIIRGKDSFFYKTIKCSGGLQLY
jgi:hypothetical protein